MNIHKNSASNFSESSSGQLKDSSDDGVEKNFLHSQKYLYLKSFIPKKQNASKWPSAQSKGKFDTFPENFWSKLEKTSLKIQEKVTIRKTHSRKYSRKVLLEYVGGILDKLGGNYLLKNLNFFVHYRKKSQLKKFSRLFHQKVSLET